MTETGGVYADVCGLDGVFVANPSPCSLAKAMAASAKAWPGPIEQPGILARTPQAMAEDICRACGLVSG